MANVAKRVAVERQLRGLSLSQLADKAGISKSYLSQLESGKQENPSLDVLNKLADALGITVGRLIGIQTVAVDPPQAADEVLPSLREFLDERRQQGRPVPEGDVRMLIQIQRRSPNDTTKQDWISLYEHLLPMWERSLGGERA